MSGQKPTAEEEAEFLALAGDLPVAGPGWDGTLPPQFPANGEAVVGAAALEEQRAAEEAAAIAEAAAQEQLDKDLAELTQHRRINEQCFLIDGLKFFSKYIV